MVYASGAITGMAMMGALGAIIALYLVAGVYTHGDEAGIKIAHCRPELYTHLYGVLEECTDQNELKTTVEVGITNGGEVRVYTEEF